MNKMLLILASVFLVSICFINNYNKSRYNDTDNTCEDFNRESSEIKEICLSDKKPLLLDSQQYSNIIYFDSKNLVYTKDGNINQKLDSINQLFFYYNITTQETTFLIEIENFSFSTQDIALLYNHLYYPLTINNGQIIDCILEISFEDLSTSLHKNNGTYHNVARLETGKNDIYKYYQIDSSADETDFYIDKLNLKGPADNIIYAKYKNNSGEILVSSCIYKNKIYTFSTVLNKEPGYCIKEYTLDGQITMEYYINLDSFLKLKEVEDYDVVYRIFRVNNYFIINTLNKRVKIYKIISNKLDEIKTPTSFESLLGANIIENYGTESGLVYFQGSENTNLFYIFNTTICDIYQYKFIMNEMQIINTIRDTTGNIAITAIDSKGEYKYYLIDKHFFN